MNFCQAMVEMPYSRPSIARSKISSASALVSSTGWPPAVGSTIAMSPIRSRLVASTLNSRSVGGTPSRPRSAVIAWRKVSKFGARSH